jgi:phosphorylcholine metabolism protein LicD
VRLPIDFEEDEVREGFYVNGMMKKIWAAQVDVLDFLNAYCKKHGIRWFMAYGTLLGAVRHHGFIPWDDDCDIWMLREDFNRLIKLLNNEENCNVKVRESRLSDYMGYIPILTNTNLRICFKEDFLRRNRDEPYASSIDIFVLDYYSRNPEDEEWRDAAVKSAINVRLALDNLDPKAEEAEDPAASEESEDSNLKENISIARTITIEDLESEKNENAACQVALKELNDLIFLTNHKFSRTEALMPQINLVYTGLISYFKNEEADLVKSYPNHLYNGFPGLDKHFFDETVELPFEGRMYPAPGAYDKVLKSFYGDYMKKVIGGADHSYPFFIQFENDILKFNELKFNPFHFDLKKQKKEDFPDPEKKVPSPKTNVQNLLSILTEFQEMVDQHLTEMDARAISEVSQNLQNIAVRIGNQIEESRTADHVCIPAIEAYCEQVYQCFGLLTRGELSSDDLQRQHDLFQLMKDWIQADYLDRKEILFLLDRRKNWKAIESLWKVFSKDPDADVSVMMMPFYYKNADSSLKKEKHIDPADLPGEVHVVAEESYQIALCHPDLIFTVNGYDYYNYIRSVSPEFYTKILWKCTDQLVYIPWFTIDAFTEEDPQWATVPFFAKIPGVVYADKTVVQSDAVRDIYVKAAEEMDESIPESYWKKKIAGWGSPLDDSGDKTDQAENIYRHLMQVKE